MAAFLKAMGNHVGSTICELQADAELLVEGQFKSSIRVQE